MGRRSATWQYGKVDLTMVTHADVTLTGAEGRPLTRRCLEMLGLTCKHHLASALQAVRIGPTNYDDPGQSTSPAATHLVSLGFWGRDALPGS